MEIRGRGGDVSQERGTAPPVPGDTTLPEAGPRAGEQTARLEAGAEEALSHWEGLERTSEFRDLVAARWRFVLPATIFFLIYYFLLPVSNGLAPGLMRTKVIGNVNLAYLFALSQFVMAWVLAYLYIRRANSVFDRLAEAVRSRAARGREAER